MPLILAGFILFFGSIVQGAIGFTLGMIAMPLLIEAGFSLSQAIALATVSIGIQALFGDWKLREHIPWADVKLAAAARFLTVPIGVIVMLSIENLDVEVIKRLVGTVILIGVLVRKFGGGKAARDLPLAVSVATFSISGFLAGLVGTGGSPLVLWTTTRKFSAHQARAFLLTLFLINAPVQVFLLLVLSKTMSLDVLLVALIMVPFIFVGSSIGIVIGDQFSKPLLNNVSMGVLVVIALNAII